MDLSKKRNGAFTSAVRNVDEASYTITHTVNTKALDRYNTVVLPKGAQVKHFLNNPVVLWAHNHDEATEKIPIGRCVDLDIRDDEIVVTTEFNRNDPLAVKIFNAYKDGFLRAWSIGFMPLKYKAIDTENMEDLNSKYGLSLTTQQIEDSEPYGAYLIYDWELYEYSAVPVPGNPEALSADKVDHYKRELVTRGLFTEDAVEALELSTEETPEVSVEADEVVEAVAEETEAEAEVVDEASEAPEYYDPKQVEAEEAAEEETGDVEDAVESGVDSTEEEEVPVVEEVEEEDSSASTEDSEEDDESVAVENDEEEQSNDDNLQALEKTIADLAQRNQALSERVEKLESIVSDIKQLHATMDEVKKSLDVDNIEKVREASQKRKAQNPEGWFSNYLKSF